MSRKTLFISTFVSAIVGFVVAVCVCAGFFFFIYKPAAQTTGNNRPGLEQEPTPTVEKTGNPPEGPPKARVQVSDVNSVTFSTSYKGFFDENSRCGKKDGEGTGSGADSETDSPCRVTLIVNRDGRVTKSIGMKVKPGRPEAQPAEKSEWQASVTQAEFTALLKSFAGDDDVIEWALVDLYRSNCTINFTHSKGTLQMMSYVTEKTTYFLPKVEVFKQLDKKLDWKKG